MMIQISLSPEKQRAALKLTSTRRLPRTYHLSYNDFRNADDAARAFVDYVGYSPYRVSEEYQQNDERACKFDQLTYQYDSQITRYFNRKRPRIDLEEWYNGLLEFRAVELVKQQRVPSSFAYGDGVESFLIQHERIRTIFFKVCLTKIDSEPKCLPAEMIERIRFAMPSNP